MANNRTRHSDPEPVAKHVPGAWLFWVCVALWIVLLIAVSRSPLG